MYGRAVGCIIYISHFNGQGTVSFVKACNGYEGECHLRCVVHSFQSNRGSSFTTLDREGHDEISMPNCRGGMSISSTDRLRHNSLKIDELWFVRGKVAASTTINNEVG